MNMPFPSGTGTIQLAFIEATVSNLKFVPNWAHVTRIAILVWSINLDISMRVVLNTLMTINRSFGEVRNRRRNDGKCAASG